MRRKVFGIIGCPVAHSLSPLMHNAAAAELGIPAVYVQFEVQPADLKKAIAGIRALGIAGINVTVPHKEKVVPLLDRLDEQAELTGAVNTITRKDGALIGSNTDGAGFIRSLKTAGFDTAGKNVAMIGAGGSSRAVAASLLLEGVAGITVVNRTPARGKKLVKLFGKLGTISLAAADSRNARSAIEESDLVVQTTPLGMKRSDPLPVKSVRFHKEQYVYDIIYAPTKTRLLQKAEREGAKIINGLGMLVYQGSESFRIWTGRRFPEKKVFGLLENFLARGK